MNEVYAALAEGYKQLTLGFRALAAIPASAILPTAEPEAAPAPALTIEDVRAVLQEKMKDHRKEVQALLRKHNSGKLSGGKPEDYAALVVDARAL